MKLSYDIFYLRNANLILDLLILIKTVRMISRGKGATPLPSSSDAAASEGANQLPAR